MSKETKLQVTATCKPPMIGHTVSVRGATVSIVDAVYMHKDARNNFIVRVSSGDIHAVTPTSKYGVWNAQPIAIPKKERVPSKLALAASLA